VGILSAAAVADEGSVTRCLESGWQHLRYYDFTRAEPLFRQVRQSQPAGSGPWIQATFALATCLHHHIPPSAKRVALARKLFADLARNYPQHRCAARALMNVARIDELRDYHKDRIDVPSARKIYRQVIQRYRDRPIAGEATLRLAQSYITTFDEPQVREGVKLLEAWLKQRPQDPLAGVMWLMLGDAYFYPLQDYRRCVDAYVRADELNSLEPGREGLFYWRIATVARRKLDDRDLAVTYYTKLITDAPSYGKGYEAQLILKQLGAPVPPLRMGWKNEQTADPEGAGRPE